MKALIPTANALFEATGIDEKLPELEYVEHRPRGFDSHTLRQVEKDLRKWAAEGDRYAQEALELLELEP